VSKALGSGAGRADAEKADRFGFPPNAGEQGEQEACPGVGLAGVAPPRVKRQFGLRQWCGLPPQLLRPTAPNGPWTPIGTVVVPSNGIGEFVDTAASGGSAFYRTVATF
jgi:hypothetical protein